MAACSTQSVLDSYETAAGRFLFVESFVSLWSRIEEFQLHIMLMLMSADSCCRL
jgi:hypothetical protein